MFEGSALAGNANSDVTRRDVLIATAGGLALAAVLTLASGALAEDYGRPTAILVSPIHEAQVVRGDDGMDHVEYELLVVSMFSEPVTLSSVTVLDQAGKELLRIEGPTLAAATQTLFSKTPSPVIPASAAVSVDVDLILPAGSAPDRVTHRITYALKADSELAPIVGSLEVDAPEVAISRRPAIMIGPPVRGDGWLATTACCKPNVHRDERIAIDGIRIETGETFAVDWVKVKNDRIFDGDGKRVEQYYGFGEDVLAVADGAVVSIRDGMQDETPFVFMAPKSMADYGGNNLILEIAPNVFAWYAHLRQGSITVKVGDAVKARAPIAKLGNTGPSEGPHLHLGLLDKPDPIAGRSLPFVFGGFTLAGAVDLDASNGDRLVILPDSRQVRSAYPLYGGIQNYP
jgi:Peptidase family M23